MIKLKVVWKHGNFGWQYWKHAYKRRGPLDRRPERRTSFVFLAFLWVFKQFFDDFEAILHGTSVHFYHFPNFQGRLGLAFSNLETTTTFLSEANPNVQTRASRLRASENFSETIGFDTLFALFERIFNCDFEWLWIDFRQYTSRGHTPNAEAQATSVGTHTLQIVIFLSFTWFFQISENNRASRREDSQATGISHQQSQFSTAAVSQAASALTSVTSSAPTGHGKKEKKKSKQKM